MCNQLLIEFSGFDEYMKSLTPEDNERNLWFRDYWEDMFDCAVDLPQDRRDTYRQTMHGGRPSWQRKLCDPSKR